MWTCAPQVSRFSAHLRLYGCASGGQRRAGLPAKHCHLRSRHMLEVMLFSTFLGVIAVIVSDTISEAANLQ